MDASLPRAAFTMAGVRLRSDAGWRRWGPFTPGVLRYVDDLPVPRLPGAGWVRLAPTLAGICGSDTKLLRIGMSRLLTAYAPQDRFVPGHEVVATVLETAPGVRAVAPGDTVLLDPYAGCLLKGYELCPPCREGAVYLCRRIDQAGALCRGQGQGFSECLGGGWGEQLVAHESQLTVVTDVTDERAVLAEPAAVALHAALRWRRTGDRAVVIGPGTIGLLLTAALRRLHPDLDIVVVTADEFGESQVMQRGASATVGQPADQVLESVAERVGARLLRGRLTSLPVLDGGVDVVFDCVATAATVDLGLRLLRARGTFVMLGTAGDQPQDWSLVWWRELQILGSYAFAVEPELGGARTQAVVSEWLSDPAFPVDGMVTHRFPLESYAEALEVASSAARHRAVKVAFTPSRR